MEQSTRKLETAPLATVAAPSGQGSALYVINLCASMAPIAQDKPVPGFETYRVYQVSRKEDGRIRYRLRLGFFADQAEAETALALIREHYPTAFAASLCDDDQRHTRGFAADASAPQPVAVVTAPTAPTTVTPAIKPAVPTQPNAAKQTPPPAPKKPSVGSLAAAPTEAKPTLDPEIERTPATVANKPSPSSHPAANKPAPSSAKPLTSKPAGEKAVELTLAAEPVAVAPSAKVDSNEPFHVGKGIDIPTSVLTLSLEPTRAEPPTVAAAAVAAPTKPQSRTAQVKVAAPIATASKPVAPSVAKPAAAPKSPPAKTPAATPRLPAVLDLDAPLPDFDSTQTIRALTAAELDDESQPKWFAVQLAVSEQPINLDTMPQLDIFAAYCLYSVATAGGGKIQHHMRIGFFKEQVSAEAVSGYLKTFFANPSVLRVSVAEYTRFSEGPKRIAPAEPKAKIIDIAAARDRSPPKEIPVVTQEVVNPATTGRFAKPNVESTGTHKRPAITPPKPAPTPANAAKSAARTKSSTSSSGKHRTLEQALLEEAREVELSESAIRRLPKNSSLLSKLFGKK